MNPEQIGQILILLLLVWAGRALLKLANIARISFNGNALWVQLSSRTYIFHLRDRLPEERFFTVLHDRHCLRRAGHHRDRPHFGLSFTPHRDGTWQFTLYFFWTRIAVANSTFIGGWAPASLEIKFYRLFKNHERAVAISWEKGGITSRVIAGRSGVRVHLDHLAFRLFNLVKKHGRCVADHENDNNRRRLRGE